MNNIHKCVQKMTLSNTKGKIKTGSKTTMENVDENMIMTGIMLADSIVNKIPTIENSPTTVTYEIWLDDRLILDWRTSVTVIPGRRKKGPRGFKIEGRSHYVDEGLMEFLELREKKQ